MHSSQRGFAGALVVVVLVIAAVVALATLALKRQSSSVGRNAQVTAQMQVLQDALTQFVAANGRLPCPANPAADDGAEVIGAAAGTCAHPEGTIPWQTIGSRRGDGIDPWAGKISYRVYTGTAGSLTQTGGTSMVDCDDDLLAPVAPSVETATTPSGSTGGLCRPDVRVTFRETTPASFLAGKGLHISDVGTPYSDVAYVLISHGPTGLGSYTTGGIRRELPAAGGAERRNTGLGGDATQSFVIQAFSSADTDPTIPAHFDDYVTYRRVEQLIRQAGRYARDWPEEATVSTSFNRTAVEAAVGGGVTSGSGVGQVSVSFTGVVASGVAAGTATEVAFIEAADLSWSGIGVAGGGSALLQSSADEVLRFDVERASKFGVTLTDFGIYSSTYYEIVEFRFFNNGVDLGTPKYGVGCSIDGSGTLASFSMDVGATFDRVDVTPYPAFNTATMTFTGITALLVSEIKSCPGSATTCVTSLTTPGNSCAVS